LVTPTDDLVVEDALVARLEEYEVVEIPLPGEQAWEVMEYSGLGWWQDELVLLPQYPDGIDGNGVGQLYAISGKLVRAFAQDPETEIIVDPIVFDDAGLSEELAGFEGFEAIVFIDNAAYLTIETSGGNPMKAFAVRGEVHSAEGKIVQITLEKSSLLELPVQNNSRNASYEALTSDGEFIYAFYEQNGTEQNDAPFAVRLDTDLSEMTQIPIEAINFRLTDATETDGNGNFWMINYFFPGDTHLAVEEDYLSDRYGLGDSHLENRPVERLVEFQLGADGFTLVDQPPIYLELMDRNVARNWEGLAALGEDGFLLITDKFPGSILAYLKIK
jgi:hypothetical protein